MARNMNNIEKFWYELKRRKIVNIITVYSALATVIVILIIC